MTDAKNVTKRAGTLLCQAVKITNAALLLLLLAIVIGEGPPNPLKLTAREWILMVPFLVMFCGLGLGVWRHFVGGIVLLAGIVGFTILDGVHCNWVFCAFWILGLLDIFCWWVRKNQNIK